MSKHRRLNEKEELNSMGTAESKNNSNNRRRFLKLSGGVSAALALSYAGGASGALASTRPALNARMDGAVIDLGSGDTGIANYAYLLEQLEADFYTRVVNTPYAGITADELQIFTDLRDHEIIHREFFRAVLGSSAIPNATFNFSEVDFTSRDSVLVTSQAFEDLGVAAYNGAGQLIESTEALGIAGKIVSVEARHAAVIRELRIPLIGYFAPDAADQALDPRVVLGIASPYIKETVSGRNLPVITAV